MGWVVHIAAALELFLIMLADTFIAAGLPLVRTLEKRRTLVANYYVPHHILNKKEVHTAEFLEEVEERYGNLLVNNQIDALFSTYLFISLLYMFRATQCS
jgi:hypothetical protein